MNDRLTILFSKKCSTNSLSKLNISQKLGFKLAYKNTQNDDDQMLILVKYIYG